MTNRARLLANIKRYAGQVRELEDDDPEFCRLLEELEDEL